MSTHTHKVTVGGRTATTTAATVPDPDLSAYATKADLAALAARVAALETPVVTPEPSRPFPAPVTTRTVFVPDTIDRTGTTDVAAALNAFIASVPDGSVIDFPTGTYLLGRGIDLNARHHLVLGGWGATLRMHTTANDYWQSAFVVRNGTSDIAIKGFQVIDDNADWSLSNENVSVLASVGWYGDAPTTRIELVDVSARNIYGDGVYIEGRNTDAAPSSHVWVHDCDFDWIGRNVLSCINVHHAWFENNTVGRVGGAMLDIEPNQSTESVDAVWFLDNTLGSPSHESAGGYGWFVSDAQVGTGVGAAVSNITVERNRVAGNPANGRDGTPRALHSRFVGSSARHHTGIVFRDNFTSLPVAGPGVIYASYVDGLTVTGNTQPLTSGTLVTTANCTGIEVQP